MRRAKETGQGGNMKIGIIEIAALLLAAAPQKQAPYKLIITWYRDGIVAIDYPSKERCEAARLAVMRVVEEKTGTRLGADIAFCIPG
jgi:hypothetical protein